MKTVDGSKHSVGMGAFKLTDRRSFQVAAVDTAGNVGTKTGALKIVPKLAKLALAAAKSALKKRGFKTGKVTYGTSTTVPPGKVIKGAASGLRPAGSKIGLRVSKGAGSSRPVTPATTPPASGATTYPPPSSPATPTEGQAQPPSTPPPPTAAALTPAQESFQPRHGRVLPFTAQRAEGLSNMRRELGFGLLAAAFSIAVVAGLRARRPAVTGSHPSGDQMLLWDERTIQAIRRFLRLS